VVHRDAGESRSEAIRKALRGKSRRRWLALPITPVVVFLPLIAVTGVTGSFFARWRHDDRCTADFLLLALTWTLRFRFSSYEPEILSREASGNTDAASPSIHHQADHGKFMAVFCEYMRRGLKWGPLARPGILGTCIAWAEIVGTYFCYRRRLGSDLLPAMDEGAFILDYIMPSGSSLTETNRVLLHVGARSSNGHSGGSRSRPRRHRPAARSLPQ